MKKALFFLMIFALISSLSVFAGGDKEDMDSMDDMDDMDSMTTASIVTDPEPFQAALGPKGTWLVAALNDIAIMGDLVVEGDFMKDGAPYRKLALYTQDENRMVTNRFTLKADNLIVRSEHTRIQSGTFMGNVWVEAKDFELKDAVVEGNIYFADAALMETFMKDDTSKVTGEVSVQKMM